MYKVIMLNGNVSYTVHNEKVNKNNSKITSGSIVKGINTISSFTFSILRDNPTFSYVYPYSSLIQVYNEKTKKYEFKGRVLKIKPSMSSNGLISKTIICEDRLGFLQDSVQPFLEERYWEGDENRSGLEEFIDHILENHNSQVDDYKKIYRGIVNVKPFEGSNNITKSLNYETTWDVIQKKLIDSFGGEIQLREVDDKLYLDYLIEIGEEKTTVIAIKKNMQSVDREIDPTSFITKLIPLGTKLEKKETDATGNIVTTSTEERLTIASVNNGSIFIETNEINRLGSIVKTVVFDDVTDPNNLLRKGNEYLQESNKLLEKHTLKVLDLSLINKNIDEFEVGNYYPIKNNLIDINENLRIIKKTINILEPLSSTFDIGDSKKLLSSLTVEQSKNNSNAIEEIKNNYVPNIALVEEITQLTSLISQTSSNILLEVKEKYTQKSDYRATTERLAQLLLQVNSIQSVVSDWGDLTATVEKVGVLELPEAMAGKLIYLSIKGQINLLYPSDNLYPVEDLYPIDDTITLEYEDGSIKKYRLSFTDLNYMNDDIYDEFIIDTYGTHVVTRVGINNEGNFYQLEEEIVTNYENIDIVLLEGLNKLYLSSFPNATMTANYVVKNKFSDVYATTVQLKSSITQLSDSINLVVSKKVGIEEVVSVINQSAEKIYLGAKRLEINTDFFKLYDNGRIESMSGKIGGYEITETSLSTTVKDKYTYVNDDLERIRSIIMGTTAATIDDLEKYDINGDGKITSIDYVIISKKINGTTSTEGVVKINSVDAYNVIDCTGNVEGTATKIGLDRMISNLITGNTIASNSSIFAEDLTVNGTLTNNSDRRLKEGIKELDDNYIRIIKDLNPVSFKYKNNHQEHIGFIAQEMEKVFNDNKISPIPIKIDEFGFYSIDYISLIGILWKVVQILNKKMEVLESEKNNY